MITDEIAPLTKLTRDPRKQNGQDLFTQSLCCESSTGKTLLFTLTNPSSVPYHLCDHWIVGGGTTR